MNVNDNAGDPDYEAQYEYHGQENYTPTSAFLTKTFLVLDVQLTIVLIAHILFGPFLNSFLTKTFFNSYLTVDAIVFPFIIVLILQIYFGPKIKSSSIKCALVMIFRTVVFYFVLRVMVPAVYFKQTTLFIALILSLHLTFTVFAWTLKGSYRRRIAFLWLMIWMAVTTGLLYLIKNVIAKGIFTHLDISVTVFLTVLYGLYLIYEMGFIIDGILYHIDHNQYMFGAFTLQYDLIGIFYWFVKKCHPNLRPRRN